MGESKTKTKKQRALSLALLRYDDEIADFSEDVAFFCDAFACLAHKNEDLGDCTIRGVERNARWLKKRAWELKEKLGQIREE